MCNFWRMFLKTQFSKHLCISTQKPSKSTRNRTLRDTANKQRKLALIQQIRMSILFTLPMEEVKVLIKYIIWVGILVYTLDRKKIKRNAYPASGKVYVCKHQPSILCIELVYCVCLEIDGYSFRFSCVSHRMNTLGIPSSKINSI